MNSGSLAEATVNQSWSHGGLLSLSATKCGTLAVAPGASKTYTFTLRIAGATPSGGPVCTFSNNSTSGTPSGSPIAVYQGQTIDWVAVQSAGSAAADPTLNLTFSQQ